MNSKERDVLWAKSGWRTRRWASAVAVFGLVSCWEASAWAQKVDFQVTTPRERFPDTRSATESLRWIINRDECNTDGAFLRFNLSITGWVSGQNFEVWGTTVASADCTQIDQQSGANARCVKLPSNLQWNGAPTRNESVQFDVKDLIDTSMEPGLADDCGLSSDNPTQRDLVIYFMLTSGGIVVPNSALKWPSSAMAPARIDLWGPPPPTNVTVTPGEASVSLSVEGAKETNSTEVAFCAKDGQILGNDDGESEASSCSCNGVGNDGGGSGGATSSSSNAGVGSGGMSGAAGSGGSSGGGSVGDNGECNAAPLVANELPDITWKPCGEGNTVKDLENNVTYAIAVAYRDQIGNVGKLSPVVCATPSPIEDFFENYEKSGGTAGGGFCSMSHRTMRNTSFSASFVLGALALVMRRRARQLRHASFKEVSK